MEKILIVDDNIQITKILGQFAKKEGYVPVAAYDGEEVLRLFRQDQFAMILLDVMMPGKDGFEVCQEIRKISNIPIIIITARGEDFERIMGLDIGADDYIVKPFSPGEVMARVRAVLRRIDSPRNEGLSCLIYDNLTVSLDNASVTMEGQKIPLTKKEMLFSASVGILFGTQFIHHTAQIYEDQLKSQAVSISETLSLFLQRQSAGPGRGKGFGAYLRFIDDISMGEAWLVDEYAQTIELATANYALSYEVLPKDAEQLILTVL